MSRCNYCQAPVLWVAKNGGSGWFPPFDKPDDLSRIRYNLYWDGISWVAEPTDKSKVMSLTIHVCVEYDEHMQNSRQLPVEEEEEESMLTIPLDDPPVEVVERIVYKPAPVDPDKIIAMAMKLSHKCVTCGMGPFKWCQYINEDQAGQRTVRLHNGR